ncbi:hypothetical protein K504DRAFT_497610 [Pleomassaria siparia CBS 279.74]|uniref:Uncharacterized protein n=1 Tax=Pleomassaria siparia CBS 279.74 TaxID=1314801 RepID=A0A6G1KSC2_9PLEO|nr:hypothetical protein K504DRAFT_497610 [Pleomassaria siparia CBS 279.74]
MPVPAKSMLPPLGAFLAFSLTYTAIVAQKEGQHVDNARTRFQQQRERGNQAMSDYGARILEQKQLQQHQRQQLVSDLDFSTPF